MGLVLVFSLPGEDTNTTNIESYTVSLTYYDDEKDLITLASTEELMEAIELFSEQKFLRITTCVKPKVSCSHSTSAKNASTSMGDDQVPTPPIQHVLESFAGILSSAVNNLQEGLATQSPTSNKPGEKKRTSSPPKTDNKSAEKAKTVDEVPSSFTSHTHEAEGTDAKLKSSEGKEKISNGSSDKAKMSEETYATPFIHGRHTCDGCLITPIVGKRYHSTNLPDYDLCQKCYDNYKGSEIKFESVELQRDVVFQERWRRRHYTASMRMKKQYKSRRGHCGSHPSRRKEDDHRKFGQTPSRVKRDIKHRYNAEQSNSNETVPYPGIQDTAAFNFEHSLKEAIRRSLDDVVPQDYVPDVVPQDYVPKEGTIEKTNEAVGIQSINSDKSPTMGGDEPPVEVRTSENHADNLEGDIPRSVDIIENKTIDAERLSCSGAASEINEEEILQNATDIDSVDSEKLVSESDERCVVSTDHLQTESLSLSSTEKEELLNMIRSMRVAELKAELEELKISIGDVLEKEDLVQKLYDARRSSKQKGLDKFKDDSFASDAVGNGDVAEEMGKTLDMVAGVISEMLSESDFPEKPIEIGTVTDDDSEQGDLIVNPNHDVETTDGDDESDWSVVKSIQSTESKQIGKATEMLGSALFNSDMKNSAEENVSNSAASDSAFSVPSSIPTELGTVNSRRWAQEIEKLRELGFDNEANCIEVLERIGSDSNTIATNVDKAVDELLLLSD